MPIYGALGLRSRDWGFHKLPLELISKLMMIITFPTYDKKIWLLRVDLSPILAIISGHRMSSTIPSPDSVAVLIQLNELPLVCSEFRLQTMITRHPLLPFPLAILIFLP